MRLPDMLTAAKRICRDPDVGDAEWIGYANEALRAAAKRVFMPDFEAAATLAVAAGSTSVALPGDYQRHVWNVCDSEGMPLRLLRTSAELAHCRLAEPDATGAIRSVVAVGSRLLFWPAPEENTTLLVDYFRLPHTLEQTAGAVTFAGDTLTATTGERLFGRFHAGDVIVLSGSAANDETYSVASASDTTATVAETLTPEAAARVVVTGDGIEGVPEELQREALVNAMLARAFETGEDAQDSKANTDRFRALAGQALSDLKININATGYRAPGLRRSDAISWTLP